MLIEHYHPVPLPSIDDAKSPQVTTEVSTHHGNKDLFANVISVLLQVISLYKRITEVIPDHGKGGLNGHPM